MPKIPDPRECKLCNGCGVFKGYACVRCGGRLLFNVDIRFGNTSELTDEEMGRWVALRLTEEPIGVTIEYSYPRNSMLPLPIIHKDFSYKVKQLSPDFASPLLGDHTV